MELGNPKIRGPFLEIPKLKAIELLLNWGPSNLGTTLLLFGFGVSGYALLILSRGFASSGCRI